MTWLLSVVTDVLFSRRQTLAPQNALMYFYPLNLNTPNTLPISFTFLLYVVVQDTLPYVTSHRRRSNLVLPTWILLHFNIISIFLNPYYQWNGRGRQILYWPFWVQGEADKLVTAWSVRIGLDWDIATSTSVYLVLWINATRRNNSIVDIPRHREDNVVYLYTDR